MIFCCCMTNTWYIILEIIYLFDWMIQQILRYLIWVFSTTGWGYWWLTSEEFSDQIESGLIVFGFIFCLQVLACLFCHWSVHVRCFLMYKKVSSWFLLEIEEQLVANIKILQLLVCIEVNFFKYLKWIRLKFYVTSCNTFAATCIYIFPHCVPMGIAILSFTDCENVSLC